MKKLVFSIFLNIFMMLPFLSFTDAKAQRLLILDRQEIVWQPNGSYLVYDVCYYGPGFCGDGGPQN
ncbi:hypothetical protein MMU07_00320 [Aquiflexum sp. LQ15W]|uniref:hypothetical protein n=1 Tax=Cognataquiflexum TaxID=3020066 RepID=UPI001F1423F9|nr:MULTISPECIES: hypothetical protein [Cognataquiflexum]MCH6198004.1 hypothetical protein [Cognataquiflexum nitidum]MCH6234532.1 hypothetical protein [Cognataquiflexum rubidum]